MTQDSVAQSEAVPDAGAPGASWNPGVAAAPPPEPAKTAGGPPEPPAAPNDDDLSQSQFKAQGHYVGTVGPNGQTTFNFNYGSEPLRLRLVAVDAVPAHIAYEPAAELEDHLQALRRHRLLVLECAPAAAAQARMQSALYSLLSRLQRGHGPARRFTYCGQQPLVINSFLHEDQWQKDQGGAVIYLTDGLDLLSVRTLFRCESASKLTQMLAAADSYLIIAMLQSPELEMALRQAIGAAAETPVWAFADPVAATTTVGGREGDDGVATAIRFCAAFFPGLSVPEFTCGCGQLLPAVVAAPEGHVPATPPAGGERDRLTRWWQGEGDALIREQGIVFQELPRLGTTSAGPQPRGFSFAAPEDRAQEPARLLRDAPLWVVSKLPTLTGWFFEEPASEPFQAGYLRLLSALLAEQLHAADAAWLMACYQRCRGAPAPGPALAKFGMLLQYLSRLAGSEGSATAGGAIGAWLHAWLKAMVEAVGQDEAEWLHGLHEGIARSASLAEGPERSDVSPAVVALADPGKTGERLDQACFVVLSLLETNPEQAANTVLAWLAGTAARECYRDLPTQAFRQGRVPEEDIVQLIPAWAPIERHLYWLLAEQPAQTGQPGRFLPLAMNLIGPLEAAIGIPGTRAGGGGGGQRPAAGPARWFGDEMQRRRAAAVGVARICLGAFEQLLELKPNQGLRAKVGQTLFAPDVAPLTGEWLARCLSIYLPASPDGSLTSGTRLLEAARFYEKICRALLTDQSVVDDAILRFAGALCARLERAARQQLLAHFKAREQSCRSRCERYQAWEQCESLRRERRHIKACHLLIRALSASRLPVQERRP